MLENLHIKNVALIEECQVSFGAGLNILTGETGAGKSMLIDSLQFALGGRMGKDFLRKGEKMAAVEALFSIHNPEFEKKLEENGLEMEEDGSILIARTLSESGKSVCRINGSMVTVGMLRELATDLIDIYGQHEHQSLLNPAKHIHLLDRFCGEGFAAALSAYEKSFQKIKEIDRQLSELMGDESQRAQRLDILQFQKEEIENACLKLGEEEALAEQKQRLSHMERLIRFAVESVTLLYDGTDVAPSAYDSMGTAVQRLRECCAFDADIEVYYNELEELYARLEDTVRDLRRYAQNLEDDPEELERVDDRLQVIQKIKRKYGGSVESALAFYENAVQEIDFLSNSKEKVEELQHVRKTEEKRLTAAATELTEVRQQAATHISKQIEASLRDMEMKNAKFHVQITQRSEWNALGKDKVEFLICANAGEDLRPLAKVASGGEMSRIMLALKAVLVDADEIETFIFDEIDTGVSGRTAAKVGQKMSLIGQKRQILCITHLPQIAAMADAHFLIEKETQGEKTVTTVTPLQEDASVREVARLMGSSVVTEATMAAARELREGRNTLRG